MSVAIKTYNLDAISFVPLYPPNPIAYRVEVMNPNASIIINLRSDPSDATTQISILPGEGKLFESSKNQVPYNPGNPLIYAIMASSTGTVKLIAH